jgi:hypothetical protein
MSDAAKKKHPFIIGMDVLIFAFTISEVIEGLFHVGLGLVLPEAALQLVMLILRGAAVWHAGRHL